MATTTLIEMDAEGHLTLPEEVRRALQTEGKAILLARATDGGVTLQAIPKEDAWAYTPEMLQRIARARQQIRDGKTFEMSEADLIALVGTEAVGDDEEAE